MKAVSSEQWAEGSEQQEGQLPKGWIEIKLEKCTHILDGYREPVSSDERNKRIAGKPINELFPYYGATGPVGLIDGYLIEGRYVLIGEDGAPFFDSNKNIAYIVDGKIWVNNHAHILDSITDNDFLCHFLNQFDFTGYVTGTTRLKLTQGKLRDIPVKFPPLNEQKRIVAKLDAIMPRIEAVKERLDKLPTILKRFRQSVLTAAVTGRLTENWREQLPKMGEWEEKPLNSIIPKGNIFDGPFGSNLKTSDYVSAGVRVIRLENIEHMSFVEGKETYITNEKYQSLLRHTVYEGDIIFSSFITENIRACVLPNLKTRAIAKADCFCIRSEITTIDTKFLLLALVSFDSYHQLVCHIHGATRPRINTTQLKKLILQLPPLEEQKEIVRQVDKLFALADKVEAHYLKAKARVDKLAQSVLAKAFRGELVPQDPNDEPAEKLLERILEEKAKLVGSKQLSGGRKKKSVGSKQSIVSS